jgi:hypothetical protein
MDDYSFHPSFSISCIGSNLEISWHVDFILLNNWGIVLSYCVINKNSFSRSYNPVSFFFEKRLERVSHASFGIETSWMCSNTSSSIVVFNANIALSSLIFHLRGILLVSSAGCVSSLTWTTFHRSWSYM